MTETKMECDAPKMREFESGGGLVACGKCKACLRKKERIEALHHAFDLLTGARRDLLRAKHVLRSAGASETATIYQVTDLVDSMDEYLISFLSDWLKSETEG